MPTVRNKTSNDPTSHLKELEKEKLCGKVVERDNGKSRNNETKKDQWNQELLFSKQNRLTKKKNNQKWDTTTDNTEMQKRS